MTQEIDELLKIIAEAEAKKEEARPKKGQVHVDRFVNDFKIKHGSVDDKIPTYVIFYTYRVKWQGISRNHKLNKITFFRLFNKMFEQVRHGKQRFYRLDPNSFDLTREGLLEAKHYDERYNTETRKKISETKKQKGKIKVSESEKELQS